VYLHARRQFHVRIEVVPRRLEHRVWITLAIALGRRNRYIRPETGLLAFQGLLQTRNDVSEPMQIGQRLAASAGVDDSSGVVSEGVMHGNDHAIGDFHMSP